MPVVAPHVPGGVGPVGELRHPGVVVTCVQCVQCVQGVQYRAYSLYSTVCTVCTVCTVQGVPGVVVCHVVPLAQVGVEASPGGKVGGVAVAEVPLTNLNTINMHSWPCKMRIKKFFLLHGQGLTLIARDCSILSAR